MGLLFVYSWDMLRALLALVGALAVFSGGVQIGAKEVTLPVLGQVVSALADASFAASLIIVAVVLGRRQLWVRLVQIVSLVLAVILIVASLLVERVTDPAALIGNAAFIAIDVAAIAAMSTPRVRSWYTEPGAIPTYVSGALVFWAAINATQIVYLGISGSS